MQQGNKQIQFEKENKTMNKKTTLKERISGYFKTYGPEIACGYLAMNGNVYAVSMYYGMKK